MTTLETPRLILRPWKESDFAPFAAMNADPKVMEFFPETLGEREVRALMTKLQERFVQDGFSFFATELKSTGEFIGFIGLNIPKYETAFTPCVEIGWRLAYAYWYQGYATEGAKACLDYGFNQLGLSEIVSFTSSLNLPSQRVMEKIGMKRDLEGDFNHPLLDVDHPLSRHVLYRINKCDIKKVI